MRQSVAKRANVISVAENESTRMALGGALSIVMPPIVTNVSQLRTYTT